ncbi:MAG: hypothetical protein ACE5DS_07685, partial [Kiloniellaceae bacterium]
PSILRTALCAITALGACGCQPMSFGRLGVLAPDYQDARIEVLARDVEGEDCLSIYSFDPEPSYEMALRDALMKVPGANVMKDVSFEFQTRVFWVCAWVKGDAGRFK